MTEGFNDNKIKVNINSDEVNKLGKISSTYTDWEIQ